MTTIDWLIVFLYFALLVGMVLWLVRRNKDTADDYFLASRNLGWLIVGASIFASNIGSEHLVGLAGSGATSGVAMAHYELHAWCLLVLGWLFVPFYSRSKVFTMPEFLERRFSPAARWMLSIISLVAYVITKIAVGIFAGGVVFGTLLPEMQFTIGGIVFNAFWIGSVAVVAADRALHRCRRHARRRVHRGGPDVHPGRRLRAADRLRPAEARRVERAARGARPGHVQPLEAAHPRRRRGHVGAGEGTWPDGLVLQQQLPVAGHADLRADHRPLVLVHRPVHRAAGPGRAERARGAARHDLRRLPEAPARLHLHHPRHDRPGAGQDGPRRRRHDGHGRPRRHRRPRRGPGGVSAHGEGDPPRRRARPGRGGPARGAHELAGRRVQRLLDALHDGPLPEVQAEGDAGTSWSGSGASPRR